MKKKKLLTLIGSICLSLVLAALLLPACAPAEEEVETVKVGFLGAFSGPASGWYIPGRTGLAIWQDEINAAGGLEVGGKRYLVEIVEYDDEGVGSKAAVGARKLVLEDDVKVIIPCCGAGVAAIQPFVNEHKILVMPVVQFDSGPDRPYTLGVGECDYSALAIQYIADNYPEVKRAAVVGQDSEEQWNHSAWVLAALEANNIDIVYNKTFITETVDFAPIVSSVLATEPDLISLGATWPEFAALICEQLYLQGYKGMLHNSEYDLTATYEKIPPEYMEGAVALHPEALIDPRLPKRSLDYYQKWLARFGPGAPEDIHRKAMAVDYLYMNSAWIWEYGVRLADSFDPTEVRDALLAADEIPHIFGPSRWWGEEIYGCNYNLSYPQAVSEVRDQKVVAQAYYYNDEWVATGNNAELLLKWLEKNGMMYWQRR